MLNHIKLILLIGLVVLSWTMSCYAQLISNHKVVYYSPKTYYAHNQNWEALQFDNGMMCFANGDGVLFYDGVEWDLVHTSQATNVLSIGMDEDERVYYGAIGEIGYLEKNKKGELIAVNIDNEEYSETIGNEFFWNVHIFDDLVVFRAEQVWVIYANGETTVIPAEDYSVKSSYQVGEYIWFQDDEYNLYKIAPDSLAFISNQHKVSFDQYSFDGYSIQGVQQYGENEIMIAGAALGIKIYNEDSHTIDHFASQLDDIDGLLVNELSVLPNDMIIVGASTHGVFVLNQFGNIVSVYNEDNGLTSNSVRDIYFDREGLLWITSDVGLYKVLFNKNYTLLTEQYEGISGISNSIIEHNGSLVVATNENVYYIVNEGGHLVTYPLEGFNEQAFDLMVFNDEIICATTSGLFVLNGQEIETISTDYTRALVQIGPNHLLVGGRKELFLWKKSGGKWELKKEMDFPDEFLHFEKDPEKENVYWGGLYSAGVAKVTVDTSLNTIIYKNYDHEELGHEGYVLPFTIQNRMLFAPKIEEVYAYNEETDKMEPDVFTNELLDEKFSSWLIKEDVYGNLFYEVVGPVYFCRKQGDTYEVDKKSLSNLNVGYINDIYCSSTGETWLVAEENIVRFNPNIRIDSEVEMELILTKITVNADSVLFNGHLSMTDSLRQEELKLTFENNNISFDFVSAYHSDEEPLLYSYKLKGNDEDFSPWSKDQKAIYTNLPEGKYTFHVKSMNADGYESLVTEYSFEVLPPWYRTWYAYVAFLFMGVVVVITIVKLNSLRLRKVNDNLVRLVNDKTKEISNNLEEISEQKNQLEERNKDILDSINYAKRLQNAIMPSIDSMKETLKDSFVLYLPKDVVAGDFFWMERVDDVVYYAAADCTGHGVPGAMVSVVCSYALSKALLEEEIKETNELLNRTRELVIKRLAKGGEDVKDGMDISICALNLTTRQLQWSGANNPVWIRKKNGEVINEIKGDKQPIGVYHDPKPFTAHEIQLYEGDSVYVFTDGYQDQFGGPKGKKFKTKHLKELILSIQSISMEEQREVLLKELMSWQGDQEQVDDVCVIGVRV